MVDASLDGDPMASREETALDAGSGSLRTLLPFVLRYKVRLSFALVFLVASTAAALAIPAAAGNFIQQGFIERDLSSIGPWLWAILGITAVIAVTSAARFYLVASLGEKILVDLRQAVFAHLLTQDVAFYDAHRVGELTSRLGSDVAAIRGVVGTTLTITIRASVTVVGALIMMLILNPLLALGIVVGGPMLALPVVLLTRRLRRMSRRAQDAIAELSATATEMLGANRTVKSFNQEQAQAQLYRDRSTGSLAAEQDRLAGRAALIATVTMLAAGALTGVVGVGSYAVLANALTVGQLAQFLVYAFMAASSVSSVTEVMGSLQTVAGATERLTELLNMRPRIRAPVRALALPVPPRGTLEFAEVSFRYPGAEKLAADRVSFWMDAGRTYALVGASGAGKSTVFSLIQRFYDVGSGSIRVDGLDVRSVSPFELRARIAAVEQDPTIFAGTIADNLRFGRATASDSEVAEAARLALIDEFSDGLPEGLDTMVGERGVRLSGGQRQRIAIGRAIVKDAPILLLDEATSALDAANEHLVREALNRLRAGRTTLVIAHRLSTIRTADEILVLEAGRIVERGTHEALVCTPGVYRELVRLQAPD